jgi:DNA-binding NarL/FixJ family response regulator
MKNQLNALRNVFKKVVHTHTNPIFIIEDDVMYGKALKAFIQNCFPYKEVKIFPIGEMSLMELQMHPTVIIIDYFLNSKFAEAHNGLEIIKQIKNRQPNTNIIVLSAQEKPGVILEAIRDYDCRYVQKDKDAFQHVERLIKEFLTQKSTATLDPWA